MKMWEKVSEDWRFWAWIGALSVTATLWAGTVTASVLKVSQLEDTQNKQQRCLARMDYNIQMIGRAVGISPLVPLKDDQ